MEAVLNELVSVEDLLVRPGPDRGKGKVGGRVLRRVRAAAQREQGGTAGLRLLPGRGELPAQGIREGLKVHPWVAADRAPEQPGQGTGAAH
ncbi:FIS1 isoform 6 [Pongo abelii]|uniref:FIS1 isoform 6 n=1 Tax=Pongo abelii TaxID=9601 RepID=A0A2J8XU79_PONAB|nr:FIS1 isoform 6 [Pongo abelii]